MPNLSYTLNLQAEFYKRTKKARYAEAYGASWGSHCAWIYMLEFLEVSGQAGQLRKDQDELRDRHRYYTNQPRES